MVHHISYHFLALKVAYSHTPLTSGGECLPSRCNQGLSPNGGGDAPRQEDSPEEAARSILKGGIIPVYRRSLQESERERGWERELKERVRERLYSNRLQNLGAQAGSPCPITQFWW